MISRAEMPEDSRWTLLPITEKRRIGRYVLCRCICGTEKFVESKSLKRGSSKSCGCFRKETAGSYNRGKTYPRFADGSGPARQTYRKMVRQGKERGYSCSLSFAEYWQLSQQGCHYCGLPPSNIAKHSRGVIRVKVSGIDRVDNCLGYSLDNCVACCSTCNRAKSTMKYSDFKEYLNRIRNFHDNAS